PSAAVQRVDILADLTDFVVRPILTSEKPARVAAFGADGKPANAIVADAGAGSVRRGVSGGCREGPAALGPLSPWHASAIRRSPVRRARPRAGRRQPRPNSDTAHPGAGSFPTRSGSPQVATRTAGRPRYRGPPAVRPGATTTGDSSGSATTLSR